MCDHRPQQLTEAAALAERVFGNPLHLFLDFLDRLGLLLQGCPVFGPGRVDVRLLHNLALLDADLGRAGVYFRILIVIDREALEVLVRYVASAAQRHDEALAFLA